MGHERPAFVLVHGAWHSSYCFSEVADRLRMEEFRVAAIDLPGHGLHARYPASYFTDSQAGFDTEPSPLSGITLDQTANAVIAALGRAQGVRKPILVGHSLGGTVITRAAELAPQLIGRLVYLTAFLPTRHPSPASLYQLPEARTPYDAPITVGEAVRIGAVRFNPRGNIAYLRELHSVFYHDVSEEQFLPFAAAMSPDLPLRLWTGEPRASAARWGSLKRTYVHCTQDRAIAPALQLKMVAEADQLTPENRTDLIEIESSHSPFASQPDRLIALLRKLAQNG
jgi:pimeloyl-ACP methyl ester carboxylesterase